jgi:hypothetical protein
LNNTANPCFVLQIYKGKHPEINMIKNKNLGNQKVKYNVHNSMSCELYVGLFSIKLFFKENLKTAKGNEQFPTCVVSNTSDTTIILKI